MIDESKLELQTIEERRANMENVRRVVSVVVHLLKVEISKCATPRMGTYNQSPYTSARKVRLFIDCYRPSNVQLIKDALERIALKIQGEGIIDSFSIEDDKVPFYMYLNMEF